MSFNMSTGSTRCVEERALVLENRALMAEDWRGWRRTGGRAQWLSEVHGTEVVRIEESDVINGGGELRVREGDAVWTDCPGVPIAILSADCLPVAFCNMEGTKVGVAHAGWRGLVAGVLETTIDAMTTTTAMAETMEPSEERLMAWLGPAISHAHFEVGPEVREAFLSEAAKYAESSGKESAESARKSAELAFFPGEGDRWYGDLFALARMRLERRGVRRVYGGGVCTYSDPNSWFSYRRNGPRRGNFATVVWLQEEEEEV